MGKKKHCKRYWNEFLANWRCGNPNGRMGSLAKNQEGKPPKGSRYSKSRWAK